MQSICVRGLTPVGFSRGPIVLGLIEILTNIVTGCQST